MAEQTYGEWIRSNPEIPTKEYKKEHMTQTAVEWLINELKDTGYDFSLVPNTIQAAQKMDKYQIKDAYEKGETNGIKSTNNANYTSLKTAEEYYNETYKK